VVCSRCATNLPQGSVFCPKCGRAVNAPSSNEASPPDALRCRRCGSSFLEGSQFCPKCGEDVSTLSQSVSVESLFREPRGKVSLVAWFLVPALLLSVAWLVMTDNPASAQLARIFHRTHTEAIGPEVISVGSGGFADFRFTVPASATEVAVRGHFRAQGKRNSDVEVQILTANGLVSWQDGYSASSYYTSGRVAQGDIEAALPSTAGTYYVVFSNKFSPKDEKTIQSEVTLSYRKWWPIF